MENCAKTPYLASDDQDFLRTLTQNLNLVDRRAAERFHGDRLEILTLITSSYFQIVRAMLMEPNASDAYSLADFSENAAITLMASSEKARREGVNALIDRQMKNMGAMIEASSDVKNLDDAIAAAQKLNVMPAEFKDGTISFNTEDLGIKKDSVFKKFLVSFKGRFTKTHGA